MSKLIEYGEQSKIRATKALDKIANIVGATLGPAGMPVLLTRERSAQFSSVFHTKDGITVLRELLFADPVEDAIHKLACQAATDTVISSGDGTSSSVLLAAAFANELRNQGQNNPQSAIRKFKKEILKSIEMIKQEAVSSEEANYRVALTSTNSDEDLTNIIMEALSKTSAYGTIVVEKNPMNKNRFTIDREFGYQSGDGYNKHNDLAISLSEKAVSNGDFFMEDVFVIPYNGNVMQVSQIANMLNTIQLRHRTNFRCLIVAYDFSDEVVFSLIKINKTSEAKIMIIQTTATAEINGPWQQLNDIAAFSGATCMDAGTAEGFTMEMAGKVKRVRVTPYKTFMSGMSVNNWVEKRAEQNLQSLELAQSQLDKDIISSRNSSLTGGLVKIIVGGGMPSELQETADRADDAIRSVQACKRSGALPGAGVSYIRAGQLANVSEPVAKALAVIHNTIMSNYGIEGLKEIEKGLTIKISDNSIQTGDFLELGIADSFETIKSVLLNGFALGSLVANLGGYAVRQNIEEMRQHLMLKQILES
jgi:chaperonin GroEL